MSIAADVLPRHRADVPGRESAAATSRDRWIRRTFWAAAITLGSLQALSGLHSMNPDGISYLDLADVYLRGDWRWAANASWSPLYPGVLAIARGALRPSPAWEYAMVHAVNFALFLASMACFELFLGELLRRRVAVTRVRGEAPPAVPDAWPWLVVGYSIFLWSALGMIDLRVATPDTIVAAVVYLIGAALMQLRARTAGWRSYAAFGALLGVGYWAKAFMFPMAPVFLAAAVLRWPLRRTRWRGAIAAGAAFALIASPLVIALSRAKGRVTYSDVGRLGSAHYHAGLIPMMNWQGGEPGSGTPKHPTRRILRDPDVFEFATPLPGTYPVWFEPAYWDEGARTRFAPLVVLRLAINSASWYVEHLAWFVVGLATLALASGGPRALRRMVKRFGFVLAPALVALTLYGIILVQTRYIAPFVTVLTLSALAGAAGPERGVRWRLLGGLAAGTSVALLTPVSISVLLATYSAVRRPGGLGLAGHKDWQTATALRAANVPRDANLGIIGAGSSASSWARLAGVRLVVELPTVRNEAAAPDDANRFWAADAADRERILSAFENTGVLAVVAEDVPPWAATVGWRRLDAPGRYIHFFKR